MLFSHLCQHDLEYNRNMKNLLSVLFLVTLVAGCATRVTSSMAEKVTLYMDESAMPVQCEPLGDVMASACANKSPCPAEVMKRNLRENAYMDFAADAVWLQNTTLSGTDVIGFGIAYKCNK